MSNPGGPSQSAKGKGKTSSAVINAVNLRDRGVMSFTPKRLDVAMTAAASDFIRKEGVDSSGFHMNAVLAEQTGIATARAKDIEDSLELRLLEKLKVVEEEAYQKGFEQGLKDGTEKAFTENDEATKVKLSHLDGLAKQISNLTPALVGQNEAQLIDLTFYLAKAIAYRDIQSNPDAIKEVIRSVTQSIQSESNITLRVCVEDMAVIDAMKSSAHQDFEFLNKMKILADPTITRGGCVIETNFGMIDATLETRFKKIWSALQEKKPTIDDVIK